MQVFPVNDRLPSPNPPEQALSQITDNNRRHQPRRHGHNIRRQGQNVPFKRKDAVRENHRPPATERQNNQIPAQTGRAPSVGIGDLRHADGVVQAFYVNIRRHALLAVFSGQLGLICPF